MPIVEAIVQSPQRPTRQSAIRCCRTSIVKTRAEKAAAEALVAPVDVTNSSCPAK